MPAMTDAEISKITEALFRLVLRLPEGSDVSGSTRNNVPGWDSLRQAELMIKLQNQFKIRFSARQLAEADSFPLVLQAVQNALAKVRG